MMNKEVPMVSGDEYDAFTDWRKVMTFKAGDRRRVKNAYRRRCRRHDQKLIAQGLDDAFAEENTE